MLVGVEQCNKIINDVDYTNTSIYAECVDASHSLCSSPMMAALDPRLKIRFYPKKSVSKNLFMSMTTAFYNLTET